MEKQFLLTKDGSTTLYLPQINETYHSIHGAIQEAQHVYIQKGLIDSGIKNNIKILEIGFGTGLNTLLSLQHCTNNKIHCDYTAIEKYPLSQEDIKRINYGKQLNTELEFNLIHETEWEIKRKLSPYFNLTKLNFDLCQDEQKEVFDVIYFDAFAPDKQAEMWSENVFSKIKTWMKPNGILVTYCCKGSVKRTLKSLNYIVEKTDGPIGKREMLRVKIS